MRELTKLFMTVSMFLVCVLFSLTLHCLARDAYRPNRNHYGGYQETNRVYGDPEIKVYKDITDYNKLKEKK